MVDHHTRVRGSMTSCSTSTIGLLFGTEGHSSNLNVTISVIDSEEVENIRNSILESDQAGRIRTKIQLHEKVFPQHKVVGWYRVVDDQDVSSSNASIDVNKYSRDMQLIPNDLDFNIHNGWMKEFHENPIFMLMNTSKKNHARRDDSAILDAELSYESIAKHSEASRKKLDDDEQLPLAMYENVMTKSGGMAFLNLEFDLEIFEPERIGVEKVLQSQKPIAQFRNRQLPTNRHDKKKEVLEVDTEMLGDETESLVTPPPALPLSAAEIPLQSAIASIEGMNARVVILLDFLQKTHSKEIPFNHSLVRQVNCLVQQIPLVMAHIRPTNDIPSSSDLLDQSYDDSMILSYAAVMTKTTNAVLSYSKKLGCLLKK